MNELLQTTGAAVIIGGALAAIYAIIYFICSTHTRLERCKYRLDRCERRIHEQSQSEQ